MAETRMLARVRREWVDLYGHMNMAYYAVVFDLATDALWPRIGLGAALRGHGFGTFAVENWLHYTREVTEGMPLACESEALAFDDKRLLVRHVMRHAEEGWEAAENEALFLCVDLATRRVGRWPAETLEAFGRSATGRAAKRLVLNPRAGVR